MLRHLNFAETLNEYVYEDTWISDLQLHLHTDCLLNSLVTTLMKKHHLVLYTSNTNNKKLCLLPTQYFYFLILVYIAGFFY